MSDATDLEGTERRMDGAISAFKNDIRAGNDVRLPISRIR